MSENMDHFNKVVGILLDQFYRAFPIAQGVDYLELANKLELAYEELPPPEGVISPRMRHRAVMPDGSDFETFVENTVAFLVTEGFIHADRRSYRLTSKALTVLNAPLPELSEPLGVKLNKAVTSAGTEAGRSAISETVGQIIGAAFRYAGT